MRHSVKTSYTLTAEAREIVLQKLENVHLCVACRAQEISRDSRYSCRNPVTNWLQAEKELYTVPAVAVTETASEFRIKARVAGFTADQIAIAALPGILVIENTDRPAPPPPGSEKTSHPLFCKIHLRRPIKVQQVTATLEDGILAIYAPKAEHMSEVERLKIEHEAFSARRIQQQRGLRTSVKNIQPTL